VTGFHAEHKPSLLAYGAYAETGDVDTAPPSKEELERSEEIAGWNKELEARVAAAAQATLEAWHVRGLDGEVKVGPHEMPAGAALGILSIEFLVHAWDFAQATGQQVVVSDEVAQHVLGVARQIITPEARGGGSFADPVEAGPDAGLLDRLVAFTGRTNTQ